MYLFEKILNLEDWVKNYNKKEIELSKLNLFIGSNNSGKSRFIREILTREKDKYLFENKNIISRTEKYELELRILLESEKIPKNDGYSRTLDIEKTNGIIKELRSIFSNKKLDLCSSFLIELTKIQGALSKIEQGFMNERQFKEPFEKIRQLYDKYYKEFSPKLVNLYEDKQLNKLYIPTLRGLRTLEKNRNHYGERTKNDYFENNEEVEIFTGLELYDRLQDMLLGEYEERERVRKFEKFLSENFFEGKSVSLIPKKKGDVIHIKIGETQDYPIYDLGDGIQSIIILTFPLFENAGKQMLIGIEEPEIYLHPGMQRKLMEALLDKEGKYGFENFQYLITTHSNHFLDLTLDYSEDIKIYESKKNEEQKFEIIRRNDENMLELMRNIGVRNSSVFLANSTIWIEGITDRKYLKKYFEIYQKDKGQKIYEEDKHYSFIEYSGGNITHW
ncbi:MAG: ATP-binding protein, partial [Psychrilyobacter sp.]|uniref:AAA family ATPase n=1 Tax=Psychrilyobacter sp. TaxID=2586924 RepID=UPI003C7082D4